MSFASVVYQQMLAGQIIDPAATEGHRIGPLASGIRRGRLVGQPHVAAQRVVEIPRFFSLVGLPCYNRALCTYANPVGRPVAEEPDFERISHHCNSSACSATLRKAVAYWPMISAS